MPAEISGSTKPVLRPYESTATNELWTRLTANIDPMYFRVAVQLCPIPLGQQTIKTFNYGTASLAGRRRL
jgi:hypothetical protein